MSKGTKSRYKNDGGRDHCVNPDCRVEVKEGDGYVITGVRSSHGKAKVYCEECAERYNMV